MKRLLFLAALGVILVACGGTKSASVVLRPKNPLASGVYLRVSGSPDAAKTVAAQLEQGGELVAASDTQGKQDCTRTVSIVTYPVTVSSLRDLDGQKVTLAVYGSGQAAPSVCQDLSGQFPGGIPVVGGNRRIYPEASSAMEPTLHCGKSTPGCRASAPDSLVVRLTGAQGLGRLAIVALRTPPAAASACGAGGTFVKRVIGLPGDTVKEDGQGFIWIAGPTSQGFVKLDEPYISPAARRLDSAHFNKSWSVLDGTYFVIGDNRSQSCDSRAWGSVPAGNIIGPVTQVIRGGAVLKPAGIPG